MDKLNICSPEDAQNREEEEDILDSERRKAELGDLIKNVLDEYDTSTSMLNVSSADEVTMSSATQPAEVGSHTTILDEKTTDELTALKEEVESLKQQIVKNNQIQASKQAFLENELRQAQVSLKQSQELLVEKQENHKKQLAIMEQIIIDLKEDNQTVNEKFEHLQSANAALNNYIKQLQEEKESDKVEENEMIQNYHKQIEALQHELQQVTDQAKANSGYDKKAIDCMQVELKEKDEQLRLKKNKIQELLMNLHDSENSCRNMANTINELQRRIKAYTARDMSNQIDIAEFQALKARMNTVLSASLVAENIIKKKDEIIEKLQKEIRCAELKISELGQRLENLEQAWNGPNDEVEENRGAQDNGTRKEKKYEEMENTNKQLQDSCENYKGMYQNARLELIKYLKMSQETISRLQHDVNEARHRRQCDKVLIEKLHSEILELDVSLVYEKERLEKCNKEINILKRRILSNANVAKEQVEYMVQEWKATLKSGKKSLTDVFKMLRKILHDGDRVVSELEEHYNNLSTNVQYEEE